MYYFDNVQINLVGQSSNTITTVFVSSSESTQYMNFAPWGPLKGDGLCLRIDVFRRNNECKMLFHFMHAMKSFKYRTHKDVLVQVYQGSINHSAFVM